MISTSRCHSYYFSWMKSLYMKCTYRGYPPFCRNGWQYGVHEWLLCPDIYTFTLNALRHMYILVDFFMLIRSNLCTFINHQIFLISRFSLHLVCAYHPSYSYILLSLSPIHSKSICIRCAHLYLFLTFIISLFSCTLLLSISDMNMPSVRFSLTSTLRSLTHFPTLIWPLLMKCFLGLLYPWPW